MDKFNNDINKLSDAIKKNDLYKRKTKNKDKPKKRKKKPKGASITDELPVVRITAMIEVRDRLTLQEIAESMVELLQGYAYSAESAPFMIGPICGLGFRAVLTERDCIIGLRDIADYLEPQGENVTLKELEVISGTAKEMAN